MSEFFHNLSWQALTNDNDSIQVKFEAATELVKSINYLIQQNIYNIKKKSIEINKKTAGELIAKEPETIKTDNEKVEDKIVEDIINNNKTDYTKQKPPPTVRTEQEIDQDRIDWNKNFLATEIDKKNRDFQIIDDINAKNQSDLIKNIVDPNDGLITNEDVDQTDYNRNDNNEPVAPQLHPNVLKVIKEKISNVSDKVNADISDIPALEDTPSIAPPEFVRPTLQDILAQDTTDKTLSDLQNVRDEIKLNFAKPTGIRSVDDKNLADYYDTLQQIRSDLFISDDEEEPDQLRIPDLEDIPDFPEILDLPSVQDIPPPERPSLNLPDFVGVPSLEDIPSGRPENLIDQIHLSYP